MRTGACERRIKAQSVRIWIKRINYIDASVGDATTRKLPNGGLDDFSRCGCCNWIIFAFALLLITDIVDGIVARQ
jgi:phosphatidylglycerophosphate synthase